MDTNIFNPDVLNDNLAGLKLIDIRRYDDEDTCMNMHYSGRSACCSGTCCNGSRHASRTGKGFVNWTRSGACSPAAVRAILVILIASGVLTAVFSLTAPSGYVNGSAGSRVKYYKSIQIEEGDTLSSIALEYISDEYPSMADYIEELKSMNGLADDTIHAGRNLVVAYYSRGQQAR